MTRNANVFCVGPCYQHRSAQQSSASSPQIETSVYQAEHLVPNFPASRLSCFSDLSNSAGKLDAQDRTGLGRNRIATLTLGNVHAVQPEGLHLDQNLILPGGRLSKLVEEKGGCRPLGPFDSCK